MYSTASPAILAPALHRVFANATLAPDSLALWLEIATVAIRELSSPVLPVMVPWAPVMLRYRLYRTEGEFFPYTGSVRIITGPLTGTTYPNPDIAASAVVAATPTPVTSHTGDETGTAKALPLWRFRSTGTPAAFTPPTNRPRTC